MIKNILLSSVSLVMSLATASDLVNIQHINPDIRVELSYATERNIVGVAIYAKEVCYLRRSAAYALSKVQEELKQYGLGLKVWDGYRPLSAQWKLWNACPDERYVANPLKGGRHTRGTAVDLTLVRLLNGVEVPMPTEFDCLTSAAHRATFKEFAADDPRRRNAQLLEDVMGKHGFTGFAYEWWHFDFKGWRDYEPLDILFEECEKLDL